MKRSHKIPSLLLILTLLFGSCQEDALLDLNIDQNSVTEMDMSYLFSLATLRIGAEYENTRANMLYAATMIQHTASLASYFSGDKYFYSAQYSGAYMETHYTAVVRLLSHVKLVTADDPALVNLNAMATILQAFDLHRMTDLYGDIPYSEAGRGLEGEEFWFPAYDSQRDVYYALVDDLKSARDRLSASSASVGNQDFIYGGDIDQWKMFANSLLMRIALRMSNVDPAKAQEVFVEANNSGAFTSNSDNAYITYTDGPIGTNRNGLNDGYWNTYKYSRDCKVSKTFIDWMVSNNDPRLMIISGGLGDPDNPSTWDTDPTAQTGLPNGYTSTTIRPILTAQELSVFEVEGNRMYSMLNIRYMDWEDPYILQTYAEVELMKAEAALKGWINTNAETHFNNGVAAAINSWTAFDPSFARPADVVNAYIAGRGFAAASEENKLRLIGEEYWAATYLNDLESYANWRRTNYPTLVPTQDPNRFEANEIPRRLKYWENEIASNPLNYGNAISRMGGDNFMTRTWWDGGN